VGPMLGVRLVEAGGFCTAFCYGIGFGSGGEPVDGYGAPLAYRGNSIHLAEDTLFC